MQDLPTTFQALIGRWPSTKAFGRQVAGDADKGRVFHRRNRVPKAHWPRIIEHAPDHGLVGITTEFLERLYEAGRGQGR